MEFTIPTRQEVIRRHREHGGQVAAVFPIHYPRALLRAHGILPMEVWGPPGIDTSQGDAHLQQYTCGIVRNGLSMLLSGGAQQIDIVLVPHGCDSLQGLGSLLQDFIGLSVPTTTLYVPRERRAADLDYFVNEINALSLALGKVSGRVPQADELAAAWQAELASLALIREIFSKRDEIAVDDATLYRVVRAAEYLPPTEFQALAGSLLSRRGQRATGPRLVLSGVVPEPGAMFDVLGQQGAIVVADDTLALGRRLYASCGHPDPIRDMAAAILEGPPDSTRGSSFEERLAHVTKLVVDADAKGVVFHLVKFCEPEQFYLPSLRRGLEHAGIQSLTLELDLNESLSNQLITRLEAFVEMIA